MAGDTSKRPQTSEQILLLAASLCHKTQVKSTQNVKQSTNTLQSTNTGLDVSLAIQSLGKKAISTHVDLVFDEQIRPGWIQS